MTSVLEKELSEIFEKVSRARKERNLSLQESYDLYFEAKEKYLVAKEKERTEEVGEWMLAIFFLVGKISENFIADWQSGKIEPTKKEIELLKEGCNEVLAAFDNHFKPNLLAFKGKSYNIHHVEVKEKISKIRELIKHYEEHSKSRT